MIDEVAGSMRGLLTFFCLFSILRCGNFAPCLLFSISNDLWIVVDRVTIFENHFYASITH